MIFNRTLNTASDTAAHERPSMPEILLFYYTLAILLISVMTAALCLSAYLVSRRRLFALAGLSFFFYFLDVALVFQDDYLFRGLDALHQNSVYFLGSQLPSVITGCGVLTTLWLLACDSFNIRNKLLVWAPGSLFIIVSLVCYLTLYGSAVGLFLFYSTRALFFAWILGYILVRALGSADDTMRDRLRRFKIPYIIAWLILAAIVAENAVFILIIDPRLVAAGNVPFFPERNFAENLLMVFGAALACRQCSSMLSLHFKTPPADEGAKVASFIDNGLPAYRARYGLSAREAEVLREVLCGKDNQHIATDMNLALSTVKVHVHNILRKTGQTNRQELMRDFRMKS